MNKVDKRVLRMIQDFESGNYEPENEEEIDRVYEAVDILRRYARFLMIQLKILSSHLTA
jgi:hypothetical protein